MTALKSTRDICTIEYPPLFNSCWSSHLLWRFHFFPKILCIYCVIFTASNHCFPKHVYKSSRLLMDTDCVRCEVENTFLYKHLSISSSSAPFCQYYWLLRCGHSRCLLWLHIGRTTKCDASRLTHVVYTASESGVVHRFIFRRVHKILKSEYYLSHVRPFVRIEELCLHWTDFY